ncbi:hypothetical protein D3P08_21595 [Paenibacillus nanensis]|uniref:Uncharacterized protein n=1 Tax=Paenibacillus nanensis TaxID=393251 RepID=A0A3A1UPH1_9BACL|nr:hypothetical protein [Paenibacillus nanensis]RIX50145.1 hypothetical protein D3P08_21595 [Paenibacillus nanensis]
MSLTNCTKCGEMMVNRRSFFCEKCMEAQKDDIYRVKQYLKTHARPTLLEVHRMTGIPIQSIQQFIKEGIISRHL